MKFEGKKGECPLFFYGLLGVGGEYEQLLWGGIVPVINEYRLPDQITTKRVITLN